MIKIKINSIRENNDPYWIRNIDAISISPSGVDIHKVGQKSTSFYPYNIFELQEVKIYESKKGKRK